MKRHYFTSWCAKMASFAEQRSGACRFFIEWLVSSTPMLKPRIEYWNVFISFVTAWKVKLATIEYLILQFVCKKSSQVPCRMCKTSRKTCDKLCTLHWYKFSSINSSKWQASSALCYDATFGLKGSSKIKLHSPSNDATVGIKLALEFGLFTYIICQVCFLSLSGMST